jgi:hypothetical protein
LLRFVDHAPSVEIILIYGIQGCGRAQAEADKKAEAQSSEVKAEKLDVKPPMQS